MAWCEFFLFRRDRKERKAKTLTWGPSPKVDRGRSRSQDSQFLSPLASKEGTDGSGSEDRGAARQACKQVGEEARDCGLEGGAAEEPNHQHQRLERQFRSLDRFSAEPSPTRSPVDKEHYLEMVSWLCGEGEGDGLEP